MPGHCDDCEGERVAQLKRCKDLQLASSGRRGRLPPDTEPELEMPVEEEDLELFNQERDDDERERYP